MNSETIFAHDQHTSEQTLNFQLLESQYHDSLKSEDIIHKDEDSRRLRVRLLFQGEENDDLQDRLAIEDDRVYTLEATRSELQVQLEQAETDAHQYQAELRVKGKEIDTLKTVLASMNDLSKDSNKLLAEKLELARELASIKPELDHLRSQASFQQKTISDKLSLQRQLSTIELELEAAKNVASKQEDVRGVTSKKEAEFEKQLEDLKKELVREKQEREQIQSVAERDTREWESKRVILEGKVEAMRTKLRTTKEELKEVQASLAQTIAQASKHTATFESPKAQNKSRKRAALSILDNTIGTPDGIAVRGKRGGQKRGKLDQTSVGEKSMFSITPYLNKTTNLQHGTPRDNEEPMIDVVEALGENDEDSQEQAQQPPLEIAADPSPTVSRVRPEAKSSKTPAAKKSKAAPRKRLVTARKSDDVARLEQVSEEQESDELAVPVEKKAAQPATTKPVLSIPTLTAEAPEPKKKKRKILGTSKTLFDEEDAEATRRPAKVLLATNRPLARLGAKKDLSAAPAAQFAAFSPLKKDKRGVQASFLG